METNVLGQSWSRHVLDLSFAGDTNVLAFLAVQILKGFSTTYLCEQAFSTVLGMKTMKLYRLNVSSDARGALSVAKPRIEKK